MSERVIQAVLFDLDGTLVDSAPDLAGAANQMRLNRGMSALPLDAYRHMAGAGARGLLGIAFGIQPDEPAFTAMRDEFLALYRARLALLTRPFDGIAAMLSTLSAQGLAWAIVTNKMERLAVPLAQQIDCLHPCSVVIGGDTTGFAKPHPQPLLEAAKRLGVEPTRCLYVGDDERDIVAGKAASMRTVAATYGYIGRCHWQDWGADEVIHSPSELLGLLDIA